MRDQYQSAQDEQMVPKASILPVATKFIFTYVAAGKVYAETIAAERAYMDMTTNTFKIVNRANLVLAEIERECFVLCKVAEVK